MTTIERNVCDLKLLCILTLLSKAPPTATKPAPGLTATDEGS